MRRKPLGLDLFLMRRLFLAAGVALGGLIPVRAAHAICDEPKIDYEITKPKSSWLLTNLRGDWAEEGFTATYSKTATAGVDASMTATLSTEAGAIFAKASASLGVTVGKSWSKADSWSYSKEVPKGKEGRIVMYRESRAFTVNKRSLRPPCKYVTVSSGTVNAPVENGTNKWVMQLRELGVTTPASAGAGEKYEEIPIAVEKDK